jgi:hypothetical protein
MLYNEIYIFHHFFQLYFYLLNFYRPRQEQGTSSAPAEPMLAVARAAIPDGGRYLAS